MLSRYCTILSIPGALYAVPGGAASAADSSKFLAQVMQDSLAEIKSCELPPQKASNDDIKAFAEKGACMLARHLGMDVDCTRNGR